MSQEIEIISTPVVVPKAFIGTCCANIAKIPEDALYDTIRSWDHNSLYGNTATAVATFINPAENQFNWQTFDSFISNHLDKRIIFVLGAPPDYLVTRAAIGGSYKGTKGNMCPDNLIGWANLVTKLVLRAKLLGKTGILWQLWNEIDQSASYADTISLLGPYTKITAQTIKNLDDSAVILGPTIAGPNPIAMPFMENYLTSSDGAGGIAADWLDGICFHLYNQVASQTSANESAIFYYNAVTIVKGLLNKLNLDLPFYVTETGVLNSNALKGKNLLQRSIVFAASGGKLCLWYSYDGGTYAYTGYLNYLSTAKDLLVEGNLITSCKIGYGYVLCTINGINYKL